MLCAVAPLYLTKPLTAQTPATPEEAVRRFYSWYLHALNKDQEPIQKSQAELSKFITSRLMAAIKRALRREEGINADPFIDAQDFAPDWEKNISMSKAAIRGTSATVNVTLRSTTQMGNKKLKVVMKKEAGAWKIDSVNGITNP